MDEGPITHLMSCETSEQMWTKLKTVYEKESVVSIHLSQQKFFTLDFNEETIAENSISKLDEVLNKLKQAGEDISDNMCITKILMSLPA